MLEELNIGMITASQICISPGSRYQNYLHTLTAEAFLNRIVSAIISTTWIVADWFYRNDLCSPEPEEFLGNLPCACQKARATVQHGASGTHKQTDVWLSEGPTTAQDLHMEAVAAKTQIWFLLNSACANICVLNFFSVSFLLRWDLQKHAHSCFVVLQPQNSMYFIRILCSLIYQQK